MPTLRYMIETQEAAERGEVIQRMVDKDVWQDDPNPNWDWSCWTFRAKPPAPLELHVNVYPQIGRRFIHATHAAGLEHLAPGGRTALFREVVPTPEPPAVETRTPREWRVNRRPDSYVWLKPTNAEAKDHPCAEGALVREVLEGDHS